jgi:hypothetical protein
MSRKKTGVDDEIDRLYALDPSEFIAARDELAKRLKGDGKANEAAEVRALRRPTVASWAANQVARRRPEDVKELLAAGAELRQAQRKVLSGVKGGGFREAMDRRRRAVAALAKAAEEFLQESGKGSAATLDAVQSTLEAASVDEEAEKQLRAGRLSKELAASSGFGGVTGLEVVAPPGEKGPERVHGRKKEEDEAARRAVRELERQAAEARRTAMRARVTATRTEDKAQRLTTEAEKAREAAKQAAREAKEAEAEAKRADAAATRAVARLGS